MQRQSKKMVIIDLAPARQTLLCELALYKVLDKELEDALTPTVVNKLILLTIEHYLRVSSNWAKESNEFDEYIEALVGSNSQAGEKISIILANIWFHDYIRRFDEFWVDLRWVVWDIKLIAANHILIDIDGDYRICEWEIEQEERAKKGLECDYDIKADKSVSNLIRDYCIVHNPKIAAYNNVPEQREND